MAEYYPLLSRAVAGLRDAPPEQRKAIYERARQALLGQLRSMQPAVPDEAINRESAALDEAITRVESEIPRVANPPAGHGASLPARVDPVVAIPPPAAEPAPAAQQPPAAQVTAEDKSAPPPPPPPPTSPSATTARPRVPGPPLPPPRPLAAPPRSTVARPAAEALTRIIADRSAAVPVIRASRTDDEASPTGQPRVPALPAAPRLQVPTFADAVEEAGARAEAQDQPADAVATDPEDAVAASRDEAVRPAAPRPISRDRFNPRFIILAGIGMLVVLGIAYAAWRLRDKPEALARSRAALIAAEQADRQAQGKVSNRADGTSAPAGAPPAQRDTPPAAPTAAPVPAAPPAPTAASETASSTPAAPPAALPPPPTPPASAPPGDTAAQTPLASPAAPTPAAAPVTPAQPTTQTPAAVPVAQRAAFLVDAPDDPQKIKTYVGTVVWRSENISPGQGQPLTVTVHADVEIPEAAMKLSMTFQKNLEPQFPASHTLDLRFSPLPNNTLGGVKQINVPQMRQDDSPTGDGLAGLPVTITENYFLVGLSRGDPVAQNLNLIKTRNWFDVPMLLTSGKVAKITFEKGATGQQVINDALQSWQ